MKKYRVHYKHTWFNGNWELNYVDLTAETEISAQELAYTTVVRQLNDISARNTFNYVREISITEIEEVKNA
ncbi:MAG: hypothetical protein K1X81_02040 [Bacteroidia bacterium]|nr:hypothetical protein [Bacteroidia bacterium]